MMWGIDPEEKELIEELEKCREQLDITINQLKETKDLLTLAREDNVKLQKIIDSFESGELVAGRKLEWKKNI